MLIFNILALGISFALLYVGITNNVEGPLWLSILIIAFIVLTNLWKVVENYLISKIEDW